MRAATDIRSRPLRRARVAGAAPRFALYALVAVLCAAGVASIVRGHKTIHETFTSSGRSFDLAAVAYATQFARTYLSYRPAGLDERAQALSPFTNQTVSGEAGVTPQGSQGVRWAEPAQEQPLPGGGELVTVAVQTSTHQATEYLAVPVIRVSGGALAIANFPAFVGPPTAASNYQAATQPQVTDGAVTEMVTRVVTNYLDDDAQDLQADLAVGAQVSLPTVALSVQQVTSMTWAQEGATVEVQLIASDPAGTTFSLAYLIGVTRRAERWDATSIAVNPSAT